MIPVDMRNTIRAVAYSALSGSINTDAKSVLNWLDSLPETQPEPPRPNWDDAPSWAMWWAVDVNGKSHWFDAKPHPFKTGAWGFHVANTYIKDTCDLVEIPLGVDWRTLIQRRPDSDPT